MSGFGGVTEEEVSHERRCKVSFKYASGKAMQSMRCRRREPM